MTAAPQMLAVARLVGWMIVHSLWQGVFLGLVYAAGRAFVRRGEPRYRLGLTTLAVLLVMQAVTLTMLWPGAGSPAVGEGLAVPVNISAATYGPGAGTASWIDAVDAALPWIALAWSAGVLLLASRAGIQWLDVCRLVRSSEEVPSWQDRLDRLAARFGLVRRVRILCSNAVGSPVLVGLFRPVVLLPLALMCRMPVAQVELILAHELAHVRRLDPLANLFQVVIETLYFHHPMVRWVSREVRGEREICCDSMALSRHPGSRRDYIEALATLGELARRQPMMLAANGGLLLERVRLIASPHQVQAGRGSPARLLAAGLGFAVAVAAVSHAWGPIPPAIAWSSEASQQLRIDLDVRAHRMALLFLDLIPHRAGAAYPRVALQDRPLPAIHATPAAVAPLPPELRQAFAAFAPPVVASPVVAARIGSAVSAGKAAPVPVSARPPVYPRQALEAGIEGRVVIEFSIGAHGEVRDMRVLRSEPEGVFDQAALAALHDWRYVASPAPAATRYRQAIGFTLHEPVARATGNLHAARARWPCVVVTGTHICRFPEGEPPHAAPGERLTGPSR